jgi:hypothetical protein
MYVYAVAGAHYIHARARMCANILMALVIRLKIRVKSREKILMNQLDI